MYIVQIYRKSILSILFRMGATLTKTIGLTFVKLTFVFEREKCKKQFG